MVVRTEDVGIGARAAPWLQARRRRHGHMKSNRDDGADIWNGHESATQRVVAY